MNTKKKTDTVNVRISRKAYAAFKKRAEKERRQLMVVIDMAAGV